VSIAGTNVGGNVDIDSTNHFLWYRGTDNKLYVTWFNGSSYQTAPITAADVLDGVFVLPSGLAQTFHPVPELKLRRRCHMV